MTTEIIAAEPQGGSLADLVESLGGIPLNRIKRHPPPGTATEADALAVLEASMGLCELIDGVLVEKAMGYDESALTLVLVYHLRAYLRQNPLGRLAGGDGPVRLAPGSLRLPDISFVSWSRIPGGKRRAGPVLGIAPDLAIEVLSPANTEKEMTRKLRELFAGGTRLAWLIEPELKSVRVYTSASDFTVLHERDTLDGGDVLPGFRLSLTEFFEEAENA